MCILPAVGSGGIGYSVVREIVVRSVVVLLSVVREIVVRSVVVLLSVGDVGVEDFVVWSEVALVGTIADSSFFFVSTTISTTRMINRTIATPTAANILNLFDLEQRRKKFSKHFPEDGKPKLKGHCHEIFVKREKPKDMF